MEEFYVIGKTREQHSKPSFGVACLHFTQTKNGWKQRPVAPSTQMAMDCMKADYISNESRNEILDWVACDFVTKRTCKTLPSVQSIQREYCKTT